MRGFLLPKISVPARSTERPSADNICLPEVAKFAAGFRKSESLTAR
ncbi:transcriptional antitermination N peptide [Yersinia aleksiciae]